MPSLVSGSVQTFVGSADGDGDNGRITGVNYTPGSGTNTVAYFAVFVQNNADSHADLTTATFNGSALAKAVENRNSGPVNGYDVWLYRRLAPGTSSQSLALEHPRLTDMLKCVAFTLEGVDQTTPERTATQGGPTSFTSTTYSQSVTAQTGDLVLDVLTSSGAITAASSQTAIQAPSTLGAAGATVTVASLPGATTVTSDWTRSTQSITSVLVPIVSAAAAAPALGRFRRVGPAR